MRYNHAMNKNTEDFIDALYPLNNERLFTDYIKAGKDSIQKLLTHEHEARFAAQSYNKDAFYELVKEYSVLPQQPQAPTEQIRKMTNDLFVGVPRWHSPQLLYNIGTAVNEAAAAAYALALDESILNVNDGLAGNALVAEHAVVNIVSKLAGVKTKPHGIFTFGGTATNLYGMKLGLKKAAPESSRTGVPENIRVFVTEDAHFSHAAAADWLGIGTNRMVEVRAKEDRTTDVKDLEEKLRAALENGDKIGTIIINGGTTYDHVIDPIPDVVALRDRLAKEFKLSYKPHIHVDTVIGWSWLFFKEYDWVENILELEAAVLEKIKGQYDRIKELWRADSWGIDFHKGIGSCPVACSLVVINNFEEAVLLSRKQSTGINVHQLAAEYSFASPVEYTLETSRTSGAPLAALAALRTLGCFGFQRNLANLVRQTVYMREQLAKKGRLQVANEKSAGFVTAIRLLPPDMGDISFQKEISDTTPSAKAQSDRITAYTKAFFDWDYSTRMRQGDGPECSFSSGYAKSASGAKLGIIKLYPVSPHFDRKHAQETVHTLIKQQAVFDRTVWLKRK
jgi:L-2,4-diaminobutyrate decarboxylase